ncbi:MAG: WbqC family protein, partial [Prolixibacteraceae bacterium]|nr:WbqC family protein [Prolixibacteraceae bacterium]
KNHGQKTLVKDVQIDYQTRWQDIHWRTIVSAYNNSPFFEYYRDDFEPFYTRPWKFLIDFNQQLNGLLLDLLEVETRVLLTQTYQHQSSGLDYRALILKDREAVDPDYRFQAYTQTFSDRFGFVPHLSIIDLLFNTGSEAGELLQMSYQKP